MDKNLQVGNEDTGFFLEEVAEENTSAAGRVLAGHNYLVV